MSTRWPFVLLVSLSLYCTRSLAQDMLPLNKDSLFALLKNSEADTNRVLLLIKIGNDYERNQPDSAIYFYNMARDLSRTIHYDIGTLKYIANYTAVLNMQNKLNESLALNKEAIDLAARLHNDNYLAMAYANTAAVYTLMHMPRLGIGYYLKCITILVNLHSESRLTVAYANLASIYSDINENTKAIAYGLKSIAAARETHDQYNLEGALNNTANAFVATKKYDTALVLLNEAKFLSARLNDKYVLSEVLIGTAEVYHHKGMLALMKETATAGYKASREIDHTIGMAKCMFVLSEYYFEKKKYHIAKTLAEKVIRMSARDEIIETSQKGFALLSDISLALGDLSSFHDYRDRSDSLADLMVSNQIIQNTQELETEYSLAKKESTIAELTRIQQLQKLSIREGKKVNTILIALVVALVLSGFLLFRNYAQKKTLLTAHNHLHQQRISELEKEKQLIAVKAVLQGQEQERERLARDLHDGLGSVLAGIKFNFVSMQDQFALTPQSRNVLDSGITAIDNSIIELRRIAHNLMPEAIMKFGLVAALQDFCERINQNGLLKVTFQSFDVKADSIPLEISSVIFRMMQELIQNIIKHASAHNALVQLMGSAHTLSITVEDDGRGFSQELVKDKHGIGFRNIQNRVIYLDGALDIISSPGKGTSVTIELPNIIA